MIKGIPFFLWLTIALSSISCAGLSKVDVGCVLVAGRDGWQHPARVIEALRIEPGDRVAEVGAGEGYWLSHLAEAVGPHGRVYAVEVEIALIEKLQRYVEREGLTNVEVIHGEFGDPKLPDGEIDLVMTCLTYHHIEERIDYFTALHQDLSAKGRVAHLDDRPESPAPISWFQAAGHVSEPGLIHSEMERAGYRREIEFDFLPAQSFQVFRPAALGGKNRHEAAAAARGCRESAPLTREAS